MFSSVKQHHFTQQRAEPVVSNCFLLPPSLLSSPAGSTRRCTRRPSSPTSARTAPRPSPTPPTWLSTSVSTRGPSPTTVPTARRPSASSPTSSSTHGKGEWQATAPAPLACPPHPRPGHTQQPACGGRGRNLAGGETWLEENTTFIWEKEQVTTWRHKWMLRESLSGAEATLGRCNDCVIFPDAWEEEIDLEQRQLLLPSFASLKTPMHTSCKIFSLMLKPGHLKMIPLALRAPL